MTADNALVPIKRIWIVRFWQSLTRAHPSIQEKGGDPKSAVAFRYYPGFRNCHRIGNSCFHSFYGPYTEKLGTSGFP